MDSDKQPTNQTSSFQFFVHCDDGLNLYVDLSSSPSDWFKSAGFQLGLPENPHCNTFSSRMPSLIPKASSVEAHRVTQKRIKPDFVYQEPFMARKNYPCVPTCVSNIDTYYGSVVGGQKHGRKNLSGLAADQLLQVPVPPTISHSNRQQNQSMPEKRAFKSKVFDVHRANLHKESCEENSVGARCITDSKSSGGVKNLRALKSLARGPMESQKSSPINRRRSSRLVDKNTS